VAVDRDRALALAFPELNVVVERGRLRFFAQAIGESDPVYSDVEAARAAGHPDLPVPPTFFFSLTLESSSPFFFLDELGIDLRRVLHGEQRFEYHAPAFAGDELTLTEAITEVYEKRGGALEFLLKQTEVRRGAQPIATLINTIVIRHPEVTR
jgi:acyl dehydratase